MLDARNLVYMKLKAPRHKDRTDVIELINSGLDVDDCRQYLGTRASALRCDVRRRRHHRKERGVAKL